ncbi:monocarboxylate transporter 12-like protein [Leptotrombidium deliense]|uniref:Monocarboxylate transporter 12-like protein n=1 Tax=Leptotrombidium deliense TaxID=299467 RepID=A0A443SEY5_9ACAR|nr:monocarboxylate transporter 12-like protein [Leptotrombidium deliense]
MGVKRKVPDGGWGWVVVFGAFTIHAINDGIIYTTAILYMSWIDHYRASVFITTLVISLMAGAALFVGPIAAAFIAVYGCRKVALFGAIISTVGLTITAYAPSIYFLFFSFGLLTGNNATIGHRTNSGCGFGFLYISAVVVITEYFETRLSLAIGLSGCGTSVGIIIFAFLIENLNEHFKWQTTVVILSAISVLDVLCAMTFIPINTSVHSLEDITTSLEKISSPEKSESESRKHTTQTDEHIEDANQDATQKVNSEQSNENKEEVEESRFQVFKDSMKTMFGTKLLLNPRFLIFAVTTFIVSLGLLAPQIFLKVRALQLNGVKETKDTNGLLTIIGVGSTIGRVFFGYIGDFKWCQRFIIFTVCNISCGIVTVVSIYLNTYLLFALYCLLFGLTSGAFVTLTSVVVTDCFGIHLAANLFGLLALFDGVAFVTGPPFIGKLNIIRCENYRIFNFAGLFESMNHKREFIIAGVLMIIGGLGYFLIPVYDYCKNKTRKSSTTENNNKTEITSLQNSDNLEQTQEP